MGGAHLGEHRVGGETAACCDCQKVLTKHVERLRGRAARFDHAGLCQLPRRRDLHEFEAVGGHAEDATCGAGPVA